MKTVCFTLRLPEDEYQRLREAAQREHRTLTAQIRHALAWYLPLAERHHKQPDRDTTLPDPLSATYWTERKRKENLA